MPTRAGIDELRLLGLLWRESPPGPRSGVGTRAVTALAVELADREGLEVVTIRRLAAEAGVTAMALYPHIGGRAELVELMLDHVAGATYARAGEPDDPDWRLRLTAVAEANWASCLAHPWVTDVAPGRSVPGPGASTKYETELRALNGIGLTDIEMEYTLTALLALVQGAARAAVADRRSREPGSRTTRDGGRGWSRPWPRSSATPAGSRPPRACPGRWARRRGRPATRRGPTGMVWTCSSTVWLVGFGEVGRRPSRSGPVTESYSSGTGAVPCGMNPDLRNPGSQDA